MEMVMLHKSDKYESDLMKLIKDPSLVDKFKNIIDESFMMYKNKALEQTPGNDGYRSIEETYDLNAFESFMEEMVFVGFLTYYKDEYKDLEVILTWDGEYKGEKNQLLKKAVLRFLF